MAFWPIVSRYFLNGSRLRLLNIRPPHSREWFGPFAIKLRRSKLFENEDSINLRGWPPEIEGRLLATVDSDYIRVTLCRSGFSARRRFAKPIPRRTLGKSLYNY